MVFAFKALIGAVVAGTGALVPVALNKAKEKEWIPESISKLVEDANTFKGIKARDDESGKNIKTSKVLKELQSKKCQLVKNPQKNNTWFDALYGCKSGTNSKAEFYYVDSVENISKETGSSLKKIVSVNYKEEANKSNASLVLKLEGSEQAINWAVEVDSVWKYFKDVNLSEKCSIDSLGLGGDVLRCELKGDERDRAVFQYVASIF